jgi:hypothetical protein
MTFAEWFDSMDIRHDIDEVFCLYRTVLEHSDSWGYDVTISPHSFVVSRYDVEPHRFTKNTAKQFCEYLDSLFELGVDGEHYRVNGK